MKRVFLRQTAKSVLTAWALLLLIAGVAYAYGETDVTADSTILRQANSGTFNGVHATQVVRTELGPLNQDYEFGFMPRLYNNSTSTGTAMYAQGYKLNSGDTWAAVFEARDENTTPTGATWGIEVDIAANGPARTPVMGQRYGMGIVVLKHDPTGPPPVIDYGLIIYPWNGDDSNGSVAYGVNVATKCTIACLRVRDGERIQLADNDAVGALMFDPKTGFAGFIRRGRFCVWCVNQTTGEVWNMRQLP